jgi:hypothetical protein
MLSRALVLAFGAFAVPSAAFAAGSDPLGQVVSLLDGLTAKIIKEGAAESKAYKEYVEWCDDVSTNTKFDIKTAASKKEALEALIVKKADEASASGSKIEELAASIAQDGAELKSATEVRSKESSDFAASEAELVDVVDTLGRAVAVVEREMTKNPASLAQVDTSNLNNLMHALSTIVDAASMNSADKKKLLGLVQAQESDNDDDNAFGAPAVAAYKSHSSGIVDVLEDLKEKAEEQLSSLRKAEGSANHNFQMLKQSLDDQIKADTKDLEEEKSAKAAAEEAKATAEGDLTVTAKDLTDAKTALETASSTCIQTAADHESTVTARKEELMVLAKAKSLLESSTGAASYSYSLFQVVGGELVKSKLHTRADLANSEIVALVKRLAREQHSSVLAQLASRISALIKYGSSAGEDPFVKIKALLTDLVTKLEAEAGSDASEKDYCDEQMAKTGEKKMELEYDLSKLSTKIDQASSKSASLKQEVKEIQAGLAKMAKEQAEADKMRAESHSEYVEAKETLEEGLTGVRNALGVLRDYYGAAAGSSAAMLQDSDGTEQGEGQPAMPEKHEKAGGAGDSIIGILEVVESDFATNLAKEETAEADAEAAYERLTQENGITKTLKDQDLKYKTAEFKALDKTIAELSGDRSTKDAELSAVVDYFAKIKERCIAKPESYEERKSRREAEIAGLKQALGILEDEMAFTQHKKRGIRSHFLAASQP